MEETVVPENLEEANDANTHAPAQDNDAEPDPEAPSDAKEWLEKRLEQPPSPSLSFLFKVPEIFDFPLDVAQRDASDADLVYYRAQAASRRMEQDAAWAEVNYDDEFVVPETDEAQAEEDEITEKALSYVTCEDQGTMTPRSLRAAQLKKARELCDLEIEESENRIQYLEEELKFERDKLENAVYKKRRLTIYHKKTT